MKPAPVNRRRARLQPASVNSVSYLAFIVAGQEYALPLLAVRELVGLGSLEAILGAPPGLAGFTCLRSGEHVPVVDLAVVLGEIQASDRRESCVLVPTAGASGKSLGLLVDHVSRTIGLAQERVVPASRIGALVEVISIAAMIPVEGGFVPVLDVDRLSASPEVRELISLGRASFPSAAARPRESQLHGSAR